MSREIFWESTQKARKEHFCEWCCEWIQPGELYERHVWVPQRGRFYVMNRHLDPDCPEERFMGVPQEMPVEQTVSLALVMELKSVMRVLIDGKTETRFEPEWVLKPVSSQDYGEESDDIPF